MGRTWLLTVMGFLMFRQNQRYRALIREVNKAPKSQGIRVLLEFLDPEQAGRTHEVVLPLPIRPAGLTSSFFCSTGLDLTVGKTINPKDAIGVIVGVRLAPTETGEWTVVEFEKLEKEDSHDSDA